MSYKVGDKVVFKGIIEGKGNNYQIRLKDTILWLSENEINEMPSKTYSDGLADAWELARKICGNKEGCYEIEDIKNIFNTSGFCRVIDSNTYQEALAKIEAYEESKAIKVGDVVEIFGKPVAVTRVSEDYTVVDAIGMGGFTKAYRICECKKTGRTVDIEHLLEQIRGNE